MNGVIEFWRLDMSISSVTLDEMLAAQSIIKLILFPLSSSLVRMDFKFLLMKIVQGGRLVHSCWYNISLSMIDSKDLLGVTLDSRAFSK